jgi:hypothetical protein
MNRSVLPVRSTKLRGVTRTASPTFTSLSWYLPSSIDTIPINDNNDHLSHYLPSYRQIHVHQTNDTKQASSITIAAHRGHEDPRTRTIMGRTRDTFINIGGPVAACDWCPVGDTKNQPITCTQYLAIAARSGDIRK